MANSHTGSKLLSMLRLAGALGKNAVHSPDKADNTRLENSQIDLVLAQALAAYTTGAAYAGFAENLFGKLTLGQRADFVLVDTDPMKADPQAIRRTKVLQTWVGGRLVWQTKP
jgi:predicted amidohydrolase YtcJ